jgi:hypothetical protein
MIKGLEEYSQGKIKLPADLELLDSPEVNKYLVAGTDDGARTNVFPFYGISVPRPLCSVTMRKSNFHHIASSTHEPPSQVASFYSGLN